MLIINVFFQLKKKTQSFNKIIVMESCWLPELQALRDETNPLHQDAKERFAYIDAAARKLKSDLQKKREELNSAINELKAELLQVWFMRLFSINRSRGERTLFVCKLSSISRLKRGSL